jgi:guanylate kinase
MQTAQDGRCRRPVVVFIGPSGSGKSTVVRKLADRGLVTVHPTWTTRPRRPDEQQGSLEHRFVSDDEFDELCRRKFFIDTASLFGLPYRYGLPPLNDGSADSADSAGSVGSVGSAGRVDAVMLRAPLVDRFAEHVPELTVYQIADTADRIRARLLARGTNSADIAARLLDNQAEVEAGRRIAHRTFVNDGSLYELTAYVAAALLADTSTCTSHHAEAAA